MSDPITRWYKRHFSPDGAHRPPRGGGMSKGFQMVMNVFIAFVMLDWFFGYISFCLANGHCPGS